MKEEPKKEDLSTPFNKTPIHDSKFLAKEFEPPEELEYQKILREAGGLESNIGIDSPYWRIRP